MAEASEFDVSTDDGFAVFFAAAFDEAYEYADHLCGHNPVAAEQLVSLVFGWARRHAQQGRVALLSGAALNNAIRNAWSDQQADGDAPPPAADSVWATGSPQREGLYEELFAELFGGSTAPPHDTAHTPATATASDDDEHSPRRRPPAYRVAAYAVLAGVIVVVLAVTLGDSGSTTTPTPTVATTTTTTTDSTSTP